MNFLKRIINPSESDPFIAISSILKYWNLKYTDKQLKYYLESHVEYPSMLAIKDVLYNYGIESAAIYKNNYQYSDFETPFITVIQQSDWAQPAFTVIQDATADNLTYLDPVQEKMISVSLEWFETIDKGIILLLDETQRKDEKNYIENKKRETKENSYLIIAILLLTTIIIYFGQFYFFNLTSISWLQAIFFLTTTVGLLLSILLLWYEIDSHNPFIKEVCGGKRKEFNCNAILSSRGANFLGISWSIWGWAYFATFFFCQLLFIGNFNSLYTIFAFSSILISPYIFYSIYYQWRVVKQWCPLCVTVQIVLFCNVIFSYFYFDYRKSLSFSWYMLISVLLFGIVILLITYLVLPHIKQSKDSLKYQMQWKRLRYNPDVFQSLLSKSNKITMPTDNLGIVIGNPHASNEIIKVCNPYCEPCSRAHNDLDYIIKNNADVRIRIIYNANGDDHDIRTPPVLHFFAMQEEYKDNKVIQGALDDWYLAEIKDYKIFASKHPIKENSQLQLHLDKIYAMRDWCKAVKIHSTPTIFINGQELPDIYEITELKNFF